MMVQTLALPHLDYACLVYNNIPAYLKLKVQRLATAGLRFSFNLRRDTSIMPYRVQLGWTTMETRRLSFLGCEAYNVITKRIPLTLFQLLALFFTLVRCSQCLNTPQIKVPSCRTSALKNSFFILAATLLSLLLAMIFASPTLVAFRTILRDFLAELDKTRSNSY